MVKTQLTDSYPFLSPRRCRIDMALDRQRRHYEIEKKWEDQNKKMFEHEFSHELRAFEEQVIEISPRQRRKDALQAQTNPEAYCRDRCVAVGECEVFEDLYVVQYGRPYCFIVVTHFVLNILHSYHMTPEQVMSFCKDCVLSDDDEPCDIPEFVNGGFHLHQL
jgi:hypothetical protein